MSKGFGDVDFLEVERARHTGSRPEKRIRGYPDKLRGEDIPLGARVIAVCDAYAAMRSSRPHRTPMSTEEALIELLRCAGTQFDPTVVDALYAVTAERGRLAVAAGEQIW